MKNLDEVEQVLIRPATFARLVDLSRASVYAAIDRGEIRAVRIGGSLRIPASELARLQQEATADRAEGER
jgi:excisionase family DNA binding protein